MKLLKKSLLFLFAAVATIQSFGCASIGHTAADNQRMASRVLEFDRRMLVDDILLFTQLHRPTRTSRWIID